MPGWIAAAIIGTGLIGGMMESSGQSQANQQTAASTAQQLAFQKSQSDLQVKMSNTAYQRAVQDMKAAGLNPMLAYRQGGASNVAAMPGTSYTAQNEQAGIGKAVSNIGTDLATAQDVKMKATQSEATASQIPVNAATARKLNAEAEATERVNEAGTFEDEADVRRLAGWEARNKEGYVADNVYNDAVKKYNETLKQVYETKGLLDDYDANRALKQLELDLEKANVPEDIKQMKLKTLERQLDVPRQKTEAAAWGGPGASAAQKKYAPARPYVRDVSGLAGSAASIGGMIHRFTPR